MVKDRRRGISPCLFCSGFDAVFHAVVEMGDGVFGGGCSQGLAVFSQEGQAQGGEVGVEGGKVVFGFHGLS